ncbi:MAG: S46 family peptidase [Bacteroidales bacterium]|nr:S46 family peptidase [Bacteroidales bacterium]
MKKLFLLLSAFLVLSTGFVKADEGMWLLSLIGKNYEDMKAKGFKLTAEDIYSINQASIKDAIVGFSRKGGPFWHFCSGEIISDQGLVLTNHHCGFGYIQQHSSLENDYIKDGFWAYSQDQELANEGLCAEVLVRMEDVTDKVLENITIDMTEADRNKIIKEVSDKLIKEAEEGTHYKVQVTDMFYNNQFFMLVYEIFEDVRLVGAPPSSIGKFGGDTDNWTWPRHTGDFAMFRIYTGPDGKPAPYSKDNIALKPRHSLPVSIAGVEEGDFAMILGFPGTTNRYITSFGLKETMDITNTWRYNVRDVKLNVLRKDMRADRKVNIQYAAKHNTTSNYWKYSFEQNKALRNLKTMDNKLEIEKEFTAWANADAKRKAIYGDALNIMKNVYEARAEEAFARHLIVESLISGPEMPWFAFQMNRQISAINENTIEAEKDRIREAVKKFYKDFNAPTDQKLVAALYAYFDANVDAKFKPSIYSVIEKKYKGNFDKYANFMFSKSVFASEDAVLAMIDNPNAKKLANDPAVIAGSSIYERYLEVNSALREKSKDLARGERLFTDGMMQINADKHLYPDANSTIRITYGNVLGYDPADAITFSHYTTLKGVIEKEDPDNHEFEVPQRLKDLYYAKDFGQYADANGELANCFITNNDITGGNSGSPVINAKGELIGSAFDGNKEAMSGDINFEPQLQRCINVDIRYVLWVVDKYAGADNLIKEMNIVK